MRDDMSKAKKVKQKLKTFLKFLQEQKRKEES